MKHTNICVHLLVKRLVLGFLWLWREMCEVGKGLKWWNEIKQTAPKPEKSYGQDNLTIMECVSFLYTTTHCLHHSMSSWRVWGSSRIKPQSLCGSSSEPATSSPAALSAHGRMHKYTKSVGPLQPASTRHKFASISLIINAAPEASPEPSSQPRRSTGHGHILSEPGPIGSIYVKQLPSGSQSLCSPGCPLQLPALLDDAFKI